MPNAESVWASVQRVTLVANEKSSFAFPRKLGQQRGKAGGQTGNLLQFVGLVRNQMAKRVAVTDSHYDSNSHSDLDSNLLLVYTLENGALPLPGWLAGKAIY